MYQIVKVTVECGHMIIISSDTVILSGFEEM